ncbi:MAG: hypothetical protein Q7R68_11045 [Nitrospirales bacterium]|nr:hypothetical protein [Nitrospirales bacterium]
MSRGLLGALSGFGRGLEKVGELAGKTASEGFLLSERAKYDELRDTRHEKYQVAREELAEGRAIARADVAEGRAVASQGRVFAQEQDRWTAQLWSAEGISEANRKQLDEHFKATTEHQKGVLALQNRQVDLSEAQLRQNGTKTLELKDGTIAIYSVNGGKAKVHGLLLGSDEKPLRLKATLSDVEKSQILSLREEMTHTIDAAKAPSSMGWSDTQRAENSAHVSELQKKIQAFGEPAAPEKAAALKLASPAQAAQYRKQNAGKSEAELKAGAAKAGYTLPPLTPSGDILNSGPLASYTPAEQAEIDSAYERLKQGRASQLP